MAKNKERFKGLTPEIAGQFGGGASHWDDLEGKPFGEPCLVDEVVIGKQSIEMEKQTGWNFAIVEIPNMPLNDYLKIGNSYSVIWDGVAYECVATWVNSSERQMFLGGFAGAFGGEWDASLGEEKPFLLIPNTYNLSVLEVSSATGGTHTFEIVQKVEGVTPIPTEMLPEPLRFGELKTIVKEITHNFEDVMYMFTVPGRLENGKKYTVVFDGVTYNLESYINPFDHETVQLGEVFAEDGFKFETYPFGIEYFEAINLSVKDAGEHTFSIVLNEPTTLDEKYLPNALNIPCTIEATNNEAVNGVVTHYLLPEDMNLDPNVFINKNCKFVVKNEFEDLVYIPVTYIEKRVDGNVILRAMVIDGDLNYVHYEMAYWASEGWMVD